MCNIVSFDASPNVKVKWNVAKEGMKCEEVSRNLVKMQTAARRKVVFTLMLQQKIFFFHFLSVTFFSVFLLTTMNVSEVHRICSHLRRTGRELGRSMKIQMETIKNSSSKMGK